MTGAQTVLTAVETSERVFEVTAPEVLLFTVGLALTLVVLIGFIIVLRAELKRDAHQHSADDE
jgi:ABC-type nickel/cobalt efflux system permease component RcnA